MLIISNKQTLKISMTNENALVADATKKMIRDLNSKSFKGAVKSVDDSSKSSIFVTFNEKNVMDDYIEEITRHVCHKYIPESIKRDRYLSLLKKHMDVTDNGKVIELRIEIQDDNGISHTTEEHEPFVIHKEDPLSIEAKDINCVIDRMIDWLKQEELHGVIQANFDAVTKCGNRIKELEALKLKLLKEEIKYKLSFRYCLSKSSK